MRISDYELYCWADRTFFDSPARIEDADSEFRLTRDGAPQGWRTVRSGLWTQCLTGRELPERGWKIHAAAGQEDAERVIEIVAAHCFAHGIDFKVLRSARAAFLLNSKGAPRGSSGKLVTIYPRDEAELAQILTDLQPQFDGVQGPYVLGDLRIGAGPLYVRYGGFGSLTCPGPDGVPVPALRRPDGGLEPDTRGPVFRPPAWVEIPDVLREAAQAYAADGAGAVPYDLTSVLAYSNGGGVYRGTDPNTGQDVVVREARPHAGLDRDGRDAIARLHTERDMLARLTGLDCVPRVLDTFTAWEHEFLVEEFVEGKSLLVEILERHPSSQPEASDVDRAAYTSWLADRLDDLNESARRGGPRGIPCAAFTTAPPVSRSRHFGLSWSGE